MVVSDGAKCYPRLCEKHGLLHASYSHRQNEFVKAIRRHHGYLQVQTGTIDGVWRLLKQAIPDQLVTKKRKKKTRINSTLWTYIGTWQWRWEAGQTGDACMKASGIELSQMANLYNVAVPRTKKHSETQKNRFGSSISGTLFRQISL